MAVFDRIKLWRNADALDSTYYWLRHVFLLSFVAASLTALIIVARLLSGDKYSTFNLDLGYCDPSGKFVYNLDGSELIPTGGSWLSLTMLFGNFEFSAAKGVDVAFDLVVGRGLQIVFAYVGFKTFSKALTHMVERDPQGVSYDVFESLAFHTPSSLYVFRMTKHLTRLRKGNAIMITWIVFASIFILAFPSLTSAMSGYTSGMESYVVDADGSLVHWDRYEIASYTINGASRIGLVGNSQDQVFLPTLASTPPADGESSSDVYLASMCTEEEVPFDKIAEQSGNLPKNLNNTDPHVWDGVPARCQVAWEATIYISKYGHNVSRDVENFVSYLDSVWVDEFNQTTLDIGNTTALGQELAQICYAPEQYSVPKDFVQNYTCLIADNYDYAMRFWNGELYNFTWFRENGVCQPTPFYSWGFSYILLLVVTALTFAWILGMYLLWLYIHLSSRVDRVGRDMGIYRASLDLAEAIKRDIGEGSSHNFSDKHIDTMSDSELRKRIAATSREPLIYIDAARNPEIMHLDSQTPRAGVVKDSMTSLQSSLQSMGRSSKQSIAKANLPRPKFFNRKSSSTPTSSTIELLPKSHGTDEWDHAFLPRVETTETRQDYDSMRR